MMRNLLPQREKYLVNFANSVYDEFRRQKYGIQSCRKSGKLWMDEIRKDLVNYQYTDDGGALCEVSIQQMGWLPVYYPTHDESCDYQPPWMDTSRYQIHRCNSGPSSIGMSYAGNNGSANIIEVNAGGCITRINVNPSITINNTTSSFTYAQNCSDPQAVWYINHNLGYTPNAWTEDCDGHDISGTLAVVNSNTITITFSTAQAGTAHLS